MEQPFRHQLVARQLLTAVGACLQVLLEARMFQGIQGPQGKRPKLVAHFTAN
jgi:hypothetical protein